MSFDTVDSPYPHYTNGTDESTDSPTLSPRGNPDKVRSASFIPYIPGQKLTPDQLDQLCPPARRQRFVTALVDLIREAARDVA